MNKKLRIAGIIAALIVSVVILTSPSDPLPIPEPPSLKHDDSSVEILAENLAKPRAITFAGDKVLVSEKSGQIRIIQNGKLLDEPLAILRTANVFDGGLLGIVAHPNFAENRYIYAYYTYDDGQLWNKIIRITEKDNKLADAITIYDKIPGSQFANGGFLKFGPDNKLYVGTGSPSDSSHLPQDLSSLAGKILRINDDGSIPSDNPFPNSPVFSYGHRNPQGMAWDDDGNMYVAELGPEKNDEINLIESGKNYGWPEQQCLGNEKFVNAVMCYDPGIEPGGIVIYSGNKINLENNFIMASLRAANLYQLDLDEGLASQKSILSGVGRIRDVVEGPDGSLYIITSNTDGKGFPDGTDDKLIRIVK